ncbi:Covalently-linked cell wall protein 12 [Cyberlindnera fabianii]|uniref:Covalently-linked cell wall protein 12 n=1 Tax=Cyberlindnera fabianii TaxID=36022 RepID=A0A1V2KYH9_CYBFA|nr:Covalently-linked cell wall protein 12 [Cyberlindnera fabianii]
MVDSPPTAVTTGVTIVTITSSGVETIYTTYCPLTSCETTSTVTYPGAISTVPEEYTTTVVGFDGATKTEIVSFYPTTDFNGGFATGTTTFPETVTGGYTTVVTITSCSQSVCSETVVTTGVAVVTVTSAGVETIYTTYCPLTTEAGACNGVSLEGTSANPAVTKTAADLTSAVVTFVSTNEAGSTTNVVSTIEGSAVETTVVSTGESTSAVVVIAYTTTGTNGEATTVSATVPLGTEIVATVTTDQVYGPGVSITDSEVTTSAFVSVIPQASAPEPHSTPSGVSIYDGSASTLTSGWLFTLLPILVFAL